MPATSYGNSLIRSARTILIFFSIHSFFYDSYACHDFVIAIEFSFLLIVIVLAHAVSHFLIAFLFFKLISPQMILNLRMVIHNETKVFKSFQAFKSPVDVRYYLMVARVKQKKLQSIIKQHLINVLSEFAIHIPRNLTKKKNKCLVHKTRRNKLTCDFWKASNC